MEKHAIYQLRRSRRHRAGSKRELTHASFHGALGNLVAVDERWAMIRAVTAFDPTLYISGGPNALTLKLAKAAGLRTISPSWPTGHMTLRACSFRANGQTHDKDGRLSRSASSAC